MDKKYRILFLTNNPRDEKLISGILQASQSAFKLRSVDSEEGFIEALQNFEPHVVVFSDGISAFPALEAFEVFLSSGVKTPFIVVSERDSAQYAMELIRKGADDFILKKNLDELPDVILNKVQEKLEKENDLKVAFSGERKFRQLVENGDDPVVVFTPQGKTTYISPAAEKLLGYSYEDLQKMDVTQILHLDDVGSARSYMSLCLENPGVPINNISARVKNKDGAWRWMAASFTNLLHDEDVCGIVNNFKDITAQKNTEIALKKSEVKFRSLFENSVDAILLSNPDGSIWAANPASCELFQYTEEELCREGREAIVDKEDSRVSAMLNERLLKASTKGEVILKRKGGSRFPAEVSSSVFLNEDDEPRACTIIRDISKRKQKDKELKALRENYGHLIEYNPLPNWIYDLETFRILAVNKAAVEQYGYSREEFLEMHLQDLRPKEEIPKLMNILQNVRGEDGNVGFGNFIHQKKDGSKITAEVHGYEIKFQTKKCRLVTSIDVTERENVLQKLEEKSKKLLWVEKLAKIGYWELGLEKERLFWSDEVYKIWGREKKEFGVELDDFLETIHPDDVKEFLKEQQAAFSGNKDLDFQHRIILPDESIKWVHEKGKLIKDDNGQPLRFEGSVQDVTDYKNAMLNLEQSEARQRGILQSQTNYLTRIDLQENYSYVNSKFIADFKWVFPKEKIVGQGAEYSVKEYHHQKVRSIFHKCLANPNQVYQVEMDKCKEDGGAKATLWDFICLTDANGIPVEIQGVGIDISERVEAERSLKESNTRYELVTKATSDAIYDWDIKDDTILWGEGFYILFNYGSEDLVPTIKFWEAKIHPEDYDEITNCLYKAINGEGNLWEAEYRFKKADGKYAYVVEKGHILRDENGKAYRMVGAIQDVTETKKLEELLDEASRFARIGSFEFDFEQDRLYWSPVIKEIYEVDENYVPNLEKRILFYKEGESRDTMSRAFKKAIEENIPYDLELQIITAKGNEKWVRKIGRPTFVDGKCIRINGSFQDITNIKNSEIKALKASEEKQVILESIGDAFFAVDNEWIVTYWNKHAEKLLECPKKEILGKNLWEIFSDAVDKDFYSGYHKAVREQSIQHFEDYLERVNKWFDVSAYPSSSGLSVYFRDITRRKKTEFEVLELNKTLKAHTKELVEANKGLEQFSFIVSHNLRSPVANILGLAELILSDEYPEEIKDNFLNELLNNVQRLDNVVTDLNDILQVKGEFDSKKDPVIFNDLVDSIKSSIQNQIEKEGVEIITNFELHKFYTVQSYLYSIFYNLITNSIKYRRAGVSPKLKITSEDRNGDVIITFEDNGLGIDLAKKGEQLFGLYKRFHDHVEGKGMGLFLVKTQVQLLGGRISVESEVNHGTKFEIAFKAETKQQI